MSHSQAFYWEQKKKMSQDSRAYFILHIIRGDLLLLSLRAPGAHMKSARAAPESETYNSEYTVCLYYTYQWKRGDTRGLSVVITQWVRTLHFKRPTDITGKANTKEGRHIREELQHWALCQPACALMFNIFPRQQGKPAHHTEPPLSSTSCGLIKVILHKPNNIPPLSLSFSLSPSLSLSPPTPPRS